MRDDERAKLDPIDLPDLGPLPGGPVFEWLAEHGTRAEEQLLERRRHIALVLEQTQWIDDMLRRIERRLNEELTRAGGQRFGHIHLHDRDSKLGRLYSLTPLAKSGGVLRRWYLTYTIRIPGKPQRTLPLVVDLLVGGRALQLCLAPTGGLSTVGTATPSIPLTRLHQFNLEGIGIDGSLLAVIVEANRWIEDDLLGRARIAMKDFQDEVFGAAAVKEKKGEGGKKQPEFRDPRQMLP